MKVHCLLIARAEKADSECQVINFYKTAKKQFKTQAITGIASISLFVYSDFGEA